MEPQEVLRESPLFRLSLSSKELFHSNFLEWLSTENRDAFRKLINQMAGLSANYDWQSNNWRVKREFKNFDLCVVAYDEKDYPDYEKEGIEDEENLRILFVVENKVKSIPYKKQLDDYEKKAKEINNKYWKIKGDELFKLASNSLNNNHNWVGVENGRWTLKRSSGRGKKKTYVSTCIGPDSEKSDGEYNKSAFFEEYTSHHNQQENNRIRFILLTLAQEFPDKKTMENEHVWQTCSYDHYVSYIEQFYLRRRLIRQFGLTYKIVDNYISFVNNLTCLAKNWQEDYYDYDKKDLPFLLVEGSPSYNHYKTAKQLRIHDLYQKLKFSYLCTSLFNQINTIYGGSYTVFPSNQGGLFKEKNFSELGDVKSTPFICVNYTYLHGDPLLEINIHPANCQPGLPELYYAIQVQGKDYRRGIQVKKNKDSIAFFKYQQNDDKLFSESIWECVEKTPSIILPGWMNINGVYSWNGSTGFNRFEMNDGTFLYQKEIINKETINDILNRMLDDLKYVI